MRRRAFIGTLAGAVAYSVARAEPALPQVAFLSTRSRDEAAMHTAAFLRGLAEAGFVERRDVTIEYRWAEGDYARLPAFAAELTSRHPAVLVAAGDPAARAAKAATATLPIVFLVGQDPVLLGLVASFSRPDGNATGVSFITASLGAKRLELIAELVPAANPVGLLVNPGNADIEAHMSEVRTAAQVLGRRVVVQKASAAADLDPAFAALANEGAGALVVQNDPFFDSRRDQLVALALHYRLPSIFHIREFPAGSGLMSYGPSLVDSYHLLGDQTGRVLKGARPAELAVVRPTRFELVINLKTAKALGLAVPASLLAAADEVIE